MTRSSTSLRVATALAFVLSAALPAAAQNDDPAVLRPAEPDFTLVALFYYTALWDVLIGRLSSPTAASAASP